MQHLIYVKLNLLIQEKVGVSTCTSFILYKDIPLNCKIKSFTKNLKIFIYFFSFYNRNISNIIICIALHSTESSIFFFNQNYTYINFFYHLLVIFIMKFAYLCVTYMYIYYLAVIKILHIIICIALLTTNKGIFFTYALHLGWSLCIFFTVFNADLESVNIFKTHSKSSCETLNLTIWRLLY